MQNINKINDYNSFILCFFHNYTELKGRRLDVVYLEILAFTITSIRLDRYDCPNSFDVADGQTKLFDPILLLL